MKKTSLLLLILSLNILSSCGSDNEDIAQETSPAVNLNTHEDYKFNGEVGTRTTCDVNGNCNEVIETDPTPSDPPELADIDNEVEIVDATPTPTPVQSTGDLELLLPYVNPTYPNYQILEVTVRSNFSVDINFSDFSKILSCEVDAHFFVSGNSKSSEYKLTSFPLVTLQSYRKLVRGNNLFKFKLYEFKTINQHGKIINIPMKPRHIRETRCYLNKTRIIQETNYNNNFKKITAF